MATDILPLRRSARLRLPREGLRGRKGPYLADPGLLAAVNAAITLGQPLLLTGEPGCGKTDFAWAVADFVDKQRPGRQQGLRECYVRSDTRARDLLYHYDALRRFGDAQHGDADGRLRSHDPRHYVELQPLGVGLVAPIQQVVLIDEIDKAPRDLPNDLLRELERGEFEIPEIPAADEGPKQAALSIHRLMRPVTDDSARTPIVIITSNVERQLPDAFLRRCVFYHIPFPDDARLTAILRARRPDVPIADNQRSPTQPDDTPHLDRLVTLFSALRRQPGLQKRPSTAELLGWAEAIDELYEPAALREHITALAASVDVVEGTLRGHSWREVPGLACLIKLREDLAELP